MSTVVGLPEIHLSNNSYTFGHWLARTKADGYTSDHDSFDLDAPYQRGSVWTLDQRRNLIKSLYMGLPIGVVIVSYVASHNPEYRIVDGKQRIETIRMFACGKFSIPFMWLRSEDRPIWDTDILWTGVNTQEVFWTQLTERCRRRFDMGTSVPALEFKPEMEWLGRDDKGNGIWRQRTDEEILRVEAELYGLVNGGGTAQTDADMARAASVAVGR